MSQPHHALLFIMTALPWQCLLQTSLLSCGSVIACAIRVPRERATSRMYNVERKHESWIVSMSHAVLRGPRPSDRCGTGGVAGQVACNVM